MISQTTAVIVYAVSIVAMVASQLLAKARISVVFDGSNGWIASLQAAVIDPLLWLVAGLLVTSAACWYIAMIRLPLSVMLPIAGLIAPLVALGAHFAFGETLTVPKIAAIALIATGVVWLAAQS